MLYFKRMGGLEMYQALYRKYRPASFDDVVSQNAILTTLQNAVKTSHISHAYLFSGPRGTGKTTVAKIFARLVNCESNGIICEQCDSCIYSIQKECMDIVEIDAASNNGVDEIRSLRDKITVLPTQLRYKVYIIDEVHMLSIGAFNALLKTLEEPPAHVIFILATTDPQKIPSTIVSRCQCYYFKKITNSEIVQRLRYISDLENIDIDDDVLELIATSAEGGLRDAIGLLDKVISYQNDSHITVNDFLLINGSLPIEEVRLLEENLFTYQTKGMFESINKYYNDGKDLIQVLKQLMIELKDQLIDYYLNDNSLNYEEQDMIDLVNLLNEKMFDIKKSDDIKMYVEIMLLHFINQHANKNISKGFKEKIISREIISSNKKEEKQVINDSFGEEPMKVVDQNADLEQFKNVMTIRCRNIMSSAEKSELLMEIENWKKMEYFTFDHHYGYLACELLDGKPSASSKDGIIICYDYDSMLEKINLHFDQITNFFQEKFSSTKKLAIVGLEEWSQLKNEYIQLIKSGKNFQYQEEPEMKTKGIPVTAEKETVNSNEEDSMVKEAIDLFGDIVEIK